MIAMQRTNSNNTLIVTQRIDKKNILFHSMFTAGKMKFSLRKSLITEKTLTENFIPSVSFLFILLSTAFKLL